jgi:SAM-dependent methyltransferase
VTSEGRPTTDWDAYYDRPYRTASFTRAITGARLVAAMRRHVGAAPVVVELGGANSCFFDLVRAELRPREYHIVDTNRLGLERFRQRQGNLNGVFLHQQDVLSLDLPIDADLVFSVGLIEHFDPPGTRAAVRAHFRLLQPGGIALITFPTPTWLYRLTRRLSEACRAWIFHDERPLGFDEVERAAAGRGTVLERRIVWSIFLTQYHVLWKADRDGVRIDPPHDLVRR